MATRTATPPTTHHRRRITEEANRLNSLEVSWWQGSWEGWVLDVSADEFSVLRGPKRPIRRAKREDRARGPMRTRLQPLVLNQPGGITARSAGITVSDQNKQKRTPIAVNNPKATTGLRGEKAKERNTCCKHEFRP